MSLGTSHRDPFRTTVGASLGVCTLAVAAKVRWDVFFDGGVGLYYLVSATIGMGQNKGPVELDAQRCMKRFG